MILILMNLIYKLMKKIFHNLLIIYILNNNNSNNNSYNNNKHNNYEYKFILFNKCLINTFYIKIYHELSKF